jgi:hypothetical protein
VAQAFCRIFKNEVFAGQKRPHRLGHRSAGRHLQPGVQEHKAGGEEGRECHGAEVWERCANPRFNPGFGPVQFESASVCSICYIGPGRFTCGSGSWVPGRFRFGSVRFGVWNIMH